jgi:formyl-CoA transferase
MGEGDGSMKPLEGLRILAAEQFLAGPYGSSLLADFGAEVIKVEPPWGDPYRTAKPVFETDKGSMSYQFARINRNKNSITLRLDQKADRDRFLELVKTADVVWENFRPGVFDKLGIGWDDLRAQNPQIIYASISGFGHTDLLPSPYAERPAFDIVAQAMSGMMMRPGYEGLPPLYLGVPMADTLAGIMAAFGVALAIHARDQTGEAQRVDISMVDVMVMLNEPNIAYYSYFGKEPPRGASATSAPYGAYQCKDGWFVLGVSSDALFAKFCDVIDAPELASNEALATGIGRAEHRETIIRPRLERWSMQLTGEEASKILNAVGIPASPVNGVSDLFEDPHVAARRMLLTVEDPIVGTFQVAGNPIKMSGTIGVEARPAPVLGRDQDRYL